VRRRLLILAVAAVVVAVDQTTKTWALHHTGGGGRHVVGPLWLNLTYNKGAAFGVGQGVTPVVVAVVVILVAGLLVFGRQASRTATTPVAVGLGLLTGGAIGNLIDRVLRHNHGQVIDFIAALRVNPNDDLWPVFNVADAAIVVGAITLVLAYSLRGRTAAHA
jgi:signal peptidase II